MVESPHDKLFKEAFGDRENASALLRSLLPVAVLEHLNLASLTLLPGTFVDDAFKESRSDVLFSARFGEQKTVLIYVLFEHKSEADRWVALQLLRYSVRIWERSRDQMPGLTHLPPIIPVLVHHSETGFRGSTVFLDLVDPVVSTVPELHRLTPKFEFLVDDLSHKSDVALRALALNAFGLLAALALRDGRSSERLLSGLSRWTDLFRAISKAPDGGRALSLIIKYLLQVSELSFPVLSNALRSAPVTEETVMTIAEQLRKEGLDLGIDLGRKEGIDLGRKEGIDLGRKEGIGSILTAMLTEKFGPLDAHTTELVAHADEPMLTLYAKRLLTASSLSDVFAD